MGAREELAAELKVEATELVFLEDLDDAQTQLILVGLRAAADRQQSQIDDAVREALRHLPKMLRGPVKKMLFRNS